MPRVPFSNSTFRRLHGVEPKMDDTVTDGHTCPNFPEPRLPAEILDLVLRIAEISAARMSISLLFHRVLDQLSLVANELSTMRLPQLDNEAAMSDGSDIHV